MRLIGVRVAKFEKQVGNVIVHCKAASEVDIIPDKVYACIQISLPILGEVVMFVELIAEIMGMSFNHVFNARVI